MASINASGHKFGLVYPGVGWCIFRSKAFLPKSLVFRDYYLGSEQINFTLNFSKGASQMRAQPARSCATFAKMLGMHSMHTVEAA